MGAISPTGALNGISAGTVTITYQRTGACPVTANITIAANTLSPISGTGVLTACTGGTPFLLTATGGMLEHSTAAVATIGSSSGILAAGTTTGASTITYTQGGCYVTKSVEVAATSSLKPITGASAVCVGNNTQLTDATALGVWGSSNATIAYVNAIGGVNGVAAGTATISYTKAGCFVTQVMSVNPNTTATITGNTNICTGSTSQLGDVTGSGVWSSSNNALATVGSTGIVYSGTAGGSLTITYGIAGGCYQTFQLTVDSATTSVGAIGGANSVCQAATTTITDAKPGGTWSSSNTSIVTVNAFGVLTGVATGTATVTYTRLACTSTKIMSVNALPVISGTLSVCTSNTTSLSGSPSGGTWSSFNTLYATVGSSSGVVTGVQAGSTNISYLAPTGCASYG